MSHFGNTTTTRCKMVHGALQEALQCCNACVDLVSSSTILAPSTRHSVRVETNIAEEICSRGRVMIEQEPALPYLSYILIFLCLGSLLQNETGKSLLFHPSSMAYMLKFNRLTGKPNKGACPFANPGWSKASLPVMWVLMFPRGKYNLAYNILSLQDVHSSNIHPCAPGKI